MKKKILERTVPPKLDVKIKKNEKAAVAFVHEIGERKVLELALYEEERLYARHFLDKTSKDYATLLCTKMQATHKSYEAGEWSEMSLATIVNDGDTQCFYYFGSDVKCSTQTEKNIKQYFDSEHNKAIYLVSSCEDDINFSRSKNKQMRKAHRIQALMDEVEPITDDFKEWLENLFTKGFIFVDPHKTKRGYKCKCSACSKNWYETKKPKHNAEMICKHCKENLKIKTRVQAVTEQKKTDIEVMLEPKENEEMNRLQKFIYQYFKENKQDYIALWKIDLPAPAIEDLLDILAPSGIAVKTVRVSGVGKLMLSIQGIERDLELVDVRQNEKETHTWSELITTIKDMFADVVYKKEGWQQFYKEQFEEVAPVQPKKEYISQEIEEIDQIPGQMNVNDFPETIPGGGQVVDNTQTESEKNVEKIKCEEESTEEIPNVEEIAEIVEEETAENVEKIRHEDIWNDVEEVDRKAIENAQELLRAVATKDYEAANYIIGTLKKQIETLMNAEKTE